MRKVICTFLTMFLAVPCMANIHINPDVVLEVIKKHVSSDKVNDTVREYNTQLKASNGTGISASKLWNVCAAAGWDIKQVADKKKCQSFVDDLVKSSTIKYFTVCTEEGKAKAKEAGGNPLCVDNVFYKLINGIDVQMEGAIQLSQEYAKVKYKDDNVICSKKERPDGPNDYVKCTSKEKNNFYEFKFDDVKQRTDKETYKDIVRGVGYIHGVEFKDSGCSLERIKHDSTCVVGYKTADKALCAKLSDSLKRFDMKASVYGVSRSSNEQFCFVNEQAKECSNDKYGLNSDAFAEVQYPYTPELKQYIKSYVTTQLKAKGKSVDSFECAGAYQPAYKYVQGFAVTDGDELNCSVNGDNVCFKFADLSEGADYSKNAGLSRLACIQYGGRVDDKNCRGLDEDFCINKLSPKLKEKGLSGAHYDRVRGGCILDEAVTERRWNLAGEIVAGVAITVVTVPAGAAGAAVGIPVLISIGTDLAFEAVMDWQRTIPYDDYKDFMSAFNKCTIDVNNFDFKIKQTIETKYCLSEVLQKNYKLVVGQMDLLAPEDQKKLASTLADITDIIGQNEAVKKVSESDISIMKSARDKANLALLGGLFVFNPEKLLINKTARLRYLASKTFTGHIDEFKRTGKNVAMNLSSLNKSEWEELSKSLAGEGIELIEKDGYMIFRKLDNSTGLSGIDDFLSRSSTLQKLNSQGRLAWVTSKTLGGKQYMRIGMGKNPNMQEAQALVSKLQSEGFYVSSNIAKPDEKFIGISRENIFGQWGKSENNWLFNKVDDGVKDAGRAADELFDAKFPGFKKVTTDGFRVSNQVFGEAVADSKVSSLFKEGYYAAKVPTKGVASGEEYVIVAVKQEGLAKDLVWNGKDLVRQIDNSAFLRNLDNYMGKEITKIGKTSVVLEEVGSDGGRAVAIMRIGERKLPFYVSTGEAGKTGVPTGKWEVFWGKGGRWFNKGGLGSFEDQERLLLDHYDSQELRQIADALNSKLGDPRDTELVLNTIGRNTKGQGFVGRANLGSISESSINSGFKYAPSSGGVNANMLNNIEDFKRYLKGLTIN